LNSYSQFDVSVIEITAPTNGCGLTAANTVTIKIFNYGADVVTPFNVSYSINGGPSVVETVNALILQNSTHTYSFTTPANLSTVGSYNFFASTLYAGDTNPVNDDLGGYVVTNTAPTVAGTVTANATVCAPTNAGTVNLAGQTGSVLNWESSSDGGSTWLTIANTTASQAYSNLTTTTIYRAKVQNGSCAIATSTSATITVTPATIAGTLSPTSATVCASVNTGTITLSGQTGAISNWQFSINGGVSWTNIVNTTNTQTYTNLITTTLYRATVRSGLCTILTTTPSTVTVNPVPIGGTLAPATGTVCATSNSGTIALSGNIGTVSNWEYSIDGGSTFINIANTTTTQSYTNLSITTIYRARLQSGVCTPTVSATSTITVTPATVAGSMSPSSSAVCSGANAGSITLSGQTGSVSNWQFSINSGASWTNIANTTTTQGYTNLTVTTWYRATVQSGTCASATTSPATVTVSPATVGGTLAPATSTVCISSNSGLISLAGQTGTVQQWEFSTNGGASWTTVANTSVNYSFSNLTTNTLFRALVMSGVCSAVYTSTASVTVNPATVAGFTAANSTVCSGTNTGNITLGGSSGSVVQWESSINGGLAWSVIANTTTTQTYNNLTTNTIYRALVQATGCNSLYSNYTSISVDSTSVSGSIASSATVCASSNFGKLSVSGHRGSVQNWEYSITDGASWNTLSNNTVSQVYSNLTTNTLYRANVKYGVCPSVATTTVSITVDSASVGGIVSTATTVCSGNNNGTLNLSGNTGSVLNWQSSNDGGLSWTNIANTTSLELYTNLTATTIYHASVQSGICPAVYSSNVVVTVSQMPIAGVILSNQTVCQNSNSGILTLAGYSGTINSWGSSTDGGATWTPITNTTNLNGYTNLTTTTVFQAIVANGACPNDTSFTATVTVDSLSLGGLLTMNDTVCAGNNNDTLNLNGQRGSIISWQLSTDGGNSWLPLSNPASSFIYNNLNQTTWYRTEIKNGVCPSVYSDTVTIFVNASSLAGMVSSATPVCELYNSGSVSISGNIGSVTSWISSTDGGATWMPITNTSTTNSFINITDTTWYAAIVQNGTCVADTSLSSVVIVYPKPVTSFTTTNVCDNSTMSFVNTTTLSSGFVQLYNWNFGDGNTSINLSPVHLYADTGNYTVNLVGISNFGCTDTFNLMVRVYPLPRINFITSGPKSFCFGDSVMIKNDSTINTTLLWSTGSTLDSITVDSAAYYALTITDTITGCMNKDSIQVIVFALPTANAGIDSNISLGSWIYLDGSGGITYDWWPNTVSDTTLSNPTVSPTTDTQYILTVSDLNGCMDKDTVMIYVKEDYNLTIPTLITPNGDGFNDFWMIKNINLYPENEVIIFNRDGQKIFGMTGYDNSWEGKYNGNLVTDGTYYFVLKFTDTGKVLKGAITVLRNK